MRLTNRLLAFSILASSVVAGAAQAACDINGIKGLWLVTVTRAEDGVLVGIDRCLLIILPSGVAGQLDTINAVCPEDGPNHFNKRGIEIAPGVFDVSVHKIRDRKTGGSEMLPDGSRLATPKRCRWLMEDIKGLDLDYLMYIDAGQNNLVGGARGDTFDQRGNPIEVKVQFNGVHQ